MLPAPESLLVYPDAYVARRLAGTQASDVGRQLGQLAESGKIHIFLIAWTEVLGGRRIPGGVARLYPSAWTIDHIDNPVAWFDPRVCEMSGDVEEILRAAISSGLALTPNGLRQMCWAPIQLHRHQGEQAWVQAAIDDAELNADKLAHASPASSVLPVRAAGDRKELVLRIEPVPSRDEGHGTQSPSGTRTEPTWLRHPLNGATIIFVHGILSDRISAWTSQNGAFWPRLVIEDQRLNEFGVYLFAYRTDALSGTYSLEDAVDSMREHFRLDGVMSSERLIFVCHSMGGILARRFVMANQLALADQRAKLAFFLVASPSLGSDYANFAAAIAPLYNAQLDTLTFSQKNQWLNTLDGDFLNLKESGRLDIIGKELVEDQFVARWSLVRLRQIVPPWTGARYFGDPIKIPHSDHATIAKPTGPHDLQHRLLVKFIGSACGEASLQSSGNNVAISDDRLVIDWGKLLKEENSSNSSLWDRIRRIIVRVS